MRRVLPFVVVLSLTACSKGAAQSPAEAGQPAQGAQAPAPAASKPVPAQLPEVIARVNGEAIGKAEFEDAIRSVEQRAGSPVPAEQRDQVYRSVLDRMIGYKLLLQESSARKLTVPDAEVEAQIARARQQFSSEAEFNQALAAQNVTLDRMRIDARQDMLVSKLIEAEIASKIAVSPADVQKFYSENPQHFQQGERVRASHILISVPDGADAAAKTAARAKAQGILAEVKGGKDFAALARQHSQDPGSGAQGGDLGFFEQGQMVGPFNDAAFTLAPGTISDLVETQFGFHIIKVVEKQAGRTVPVDEAREQIAQYLEAQNRDKVTDAFVDGLRSKGKIELFI